MKRMMTEELSERVETVYADVYFYPTALAILLLLAEAFVPQATRRKATRTPTSPPKKREGSRSPKRRKVTTIAGAALVLLTASGCRGGFFTRHSPAVDDALKTLDAGDPAKASELLETYLSTGQCQKGELGTPDAVRRQGNASLDLGLTLFRVAEKFGKRFGDDTKPAPGTPDHGDERNDEIDCALRVVRIVATDGTSPIDLQAKAEYLTGNLEFLRQGYEDAVSAYDAALKLMPARTQDEKSTAADAAWNRSIALRRIEDKQKEKPDAGPQNHPDGGEPQDAGKKKQPEPSPDAGNPSKKNDDKKNDDKKNKPSPESRKDQQPKQAPQKKPQPSLSQDERILDNLEQAPTVQQEAAKRSAAHGNASGMEDK